MRDRLIELIENGQRFFMEDDDYEKSSEFLADRLLASGVIVPPCKVGDYLWFVTGNRLIYGVVENIINNHSGLFAYVFELDDGDVVDEWSIPLCDFGKTVFLSKEEAEKALGKDKDALSKNEDVKGGAE